MSRLCLLGMGLMVMALAFSGSSCAPNQNDYPVEVGVYKGELLDSDGGVVGSIELVTTSPTTLGAVSIIFPVTPTDGLSASVLRHDSAGAPDAETTPGREFSMSESLEIGGLADRSFASTAVSTDASVTFSGNFYIKGVGDEYTVATGSQGTVTDAAGQYTFTADLDTSDVDGDPDN